MLARLRQLRNDYGLREGLRRELRLKRDRAFKRVTLGRFVRDLKRLGVAPGDIVFVHSALSRLGYVVGGTGTFISALQDAVAESGTILMPAFSWGGLVLEYVRGAPVFDVRTTPADLGTVPETFRCTVATSRSLHPTHSVSGWGRYAAALLEGHERADGPFGPGTPFVKCLEAGGRGLIIGARVHNYTTLRAIEDIRGDYPFPVYWPERFALDVVDWHGRRLTVTTKVHNPLLGPYRNGDLLIPYFKDYGILREGMVGYSKAYLIEGRSLLKVLDELVDRRILPFTITLEEFRQRHASCSAI